MSSACLPCGFIQAATSSCPGVIRRFAGSRSALGRAYRTPNVRIIALHSTASALCVSRVPEKIDHNGENARAINKYVHKNTKKQSDTSNE